MNARKFWSLALPMLLLAGVTSGGERFLLNISGQSRTVGSDGEIVVSPLNSATLIRDCLGTTNNFVLVYDLGATEVADFIEVVNTSNGEVFCIPFQLYPPTVHSNFDGNFVNVTSGTQSETRRIRYFFGPQSAHSVGTLNLTVKTIPGKKGAPPKTLISGEFQYFILPQGSEGVKLCSGTISASEKYNP